MKPIFRLGSPPEIKYSGEVFTLKVNFKQIVKNVLIILSYLWSS